MSDFPPNLTPPPEAAPQPAPAPESPNGTQPHAEPAAPLLADRVAREVTLTMRAIEQLDMRAQTLQIELAFLIGVALLLTAAAAYAVKRSAVP
jgi:hypothetical protein